MIIPQLKPATGFPETVISSMLRTSRERIRSEERLNQKARFVPESLEVDFRVLEGGGESRRIKS